MDTKDLEAKIQEATIECIMGLIPFYFTVAKALLFVLALFFSVVIVGVLTAGKLLLNAIALAANISAQRQHKQAHPLEAGVGR